MKKVFLITATANGITIRNKNTGGKMTAKLVNGEIVRENIGLEGKDHQYALNLSGFIAEAVTQPKLKKLGFAAYFKTMADMLQGVADSTSFRSLSNRARKAAETAKLVQPGIFFYESCR